MLCGFSEEEFRKAIQDSAFVRLGYIGTRNELLLNRFLNPIKPIERSREENEAQIELIIKEFKKRKFKKWSRKLVHGQPVTLCFVDEKLHLVVEPVMLWGAVLLNLSFLQEARIKARDYLHASDMIDVRDVDSFFKWYDCISEFNKKEPIDAKIEEIIQLTNKKLNFASSRIKAAIEENYEKDFIQNVTLDSRYGREILNVIGGKENENLVQIHGKDIMISLNYASSPSMKQASPRTRPRINIQFDLKFQDLSCSDLDYGVEQINEFLDSCQRLHKSLRMGD